MLVEPVCGVTKTTLPASFSSPRLPLSCITCAVIVEGVKPRREIVGVSADHKVLTVAEPPTPFLHVARSQRSGTYVAIIARTRTGSR